MVQGAFNGFNQLLDGAVSKRLDDELGIAFDNAYDMRTSATKVRVVTLTINIKPNAIRDEAIVTFDAKSKLAPMEPLRQIVFMRQRDDGSVQVTERTNQVPGQVDMDGGEQKIPNVIDFPSPQASADQ